MVVEPLELTPDRAECDQGDGVAARGEHDGEIVEAAEQASGTSPMPRSYEPVLS